jgi:alpha-glucuronidase
MFKEILEFQTYGSFGQSRVSDVVSGRTYRKSTCGMATVCNTGNDINWTGHDLAGVNTYGFGRLSYDTSLTAEDIAKEWIQMTYGSDERVEKVLLEMLMQSRSIYEKYTSPLGVGWMVQPNHHYNPSVDGYEYSRWGTYHRADHLGIGVDRTLKGTGFTGQYNEPNASMYESLDTCPEELLLFFHHVAYTYRLSSGKTVIQHIYDTHFQGVEEVKDMIDSFKTLNGFLEETVYQRILSRLLEQQESATEWCDQINSYFKRKSGIEDEKNRIIY